MRVQVTTALCGSETWNMGQRERKRLNEAEMNCLRYMCRVTWRDRICSEEVTMKTGVVRDLAGQANIRKC